MRVPTFDVQGQQMAYVDEGEGDAILLLHGEPTWSYLWRNVIPELPGRKVAPDLIGFGRSDKPEDMGWYSYDRHVESVVALVEHLDLRDLTLVVHDWGGPIGLRFAVEHPERVARLAVLNTGIGGGRAPSDTWLRFRDVVRELGGALDIGRLVEAGTTNGLSDEVRAAYDDCFPTPESKAGALAFPELVPAEPEHPNTAPLNKVLESLRSWTKPTAVIWGMDDRVLPRSLAERIAALIPGAERVVPIEGASHFLQEDKPAEVAAAIRELLAR
jgi:haloalkane dehalogenase